MTRRTHIVRAVVLATLCASWTLAGCANRATMSSVLPEDPIALVFWDREDARKRADVMAQAEERPQAQREGVASAESLGAFLGLRRGPQGALQQQLARWPGYVALFYPRSGRLERLHAAPPGARPLAFSADHQKLLYSSARVSGLSQLYLVDLRTGDVHAVTRGSEAHPLGDMDAQGRLVYAGLRRDGKEIRSRIYVRGQGEVRGEVIHEGEYHDNVRWANEDTALLVRPDLDGMRSGRPGAPSLVLQPVDGGEERILGRGADPVRSRDGKWLVYAAPIRGGGWRLARMRPDGAGRTAVGKGIRDERMPAISPDGQFVAYVSREGEFDHLFIKRIDGQGDRVLVDDGGAAWPVW